MAEFKCQHCHKGFKCQSGKRHHEARHSIFLKNMNISSVARDPHIYDYWALPCGVPSRNRTKWYRFSCRDRAGLSIRLFCPLCYDVIMVPLTPLPNSAYITLHYYVFPDVVIDSEYFGLLGLLGNWTRYDKTVFSVQSSHWKSDLTTWMDELQSPTHPDNVSPSPLPLSSSPHSHSPVHITSLPSPPLTPIEQVPPITPPHQLMLSLNYQPPSQSPYHHLHPAGPHRLTMKLTLQVFHSLP